MKDSAFVLAVFVALFATTSPSSEAYSRRSTELLKYTCQQETFIRDITVFANGTVRLREGPPGSRSLLLAELEARELRSIVKRLRAVDLSETDDSYESDLGDGLESCIIRVDPEGSGEVVEVRFAPLEVSTLAVTQLTEVAEELAKRTRSLTDQGRDLPLDYKPERGDILRRFDGLLFEVLYFSSDGLEVELEGVGQPMTIIVPIIDIPEVFDSIEPRGES